MKERDKISDIDSQKIYQHIYELSKKDYKSERVRTFARRSLFIVIIIFSAIGLFFSPIYFFFIHDHVKKLKGQLLQYRGSIITLNNEINRLTSNETEYRKQLKVYEDTFRRLRIEDNKIVDFDLSESVQTYIEKIDGNDYPGVSNKYIRNRNAMQENTDSTSPIVVANFV